MKIVFLGPPGGGKGTIAKMAFRKYGFTQISVGDILRENVVKNTKLGLEAKKWMDAGNLVPDKLVIALVKEEIKGKESFILDGFPRTIEQAEALESITKIDKVIDFNVSDKVIIQRLSGRRICKKCKAIYHVVNMPPKKENVCDRCGTTLYQRKDDKPDAVKERLIVYREQTEPLIDYYEKKGLLIKVNAETTPKEIFNSITKIIEG